MGAFRGNGGLAARIERMTKAITAEQRAEAEDMGYDLCEDCGVSYLPAPGYQNNGHQCGEDGLQSKYAE